MKKYLIALIFFFSVPLFAQQLWWVDTTSTGNPGKKVFLGEWQGTKFNINYSPLPVKLIGGTVVTDTVNFTQLDSMTAVLLLGNIELTGINTKLTIQITRHTADSLNFVAMKTRLDSLTADVATSKARLDSIALSNTAALTKADSLIADLALATSRLAQVKQNLDSLITVMNDTTITTSTTNGNLQVTQLLLLEQLQNRINLGGLQTYSMRRGDFTATPKVGGKSIAFTGATFTPSYLNVAYAYIRNSSTGAFTLLPNTDVRDSVAGTSIRWDDMTTPFTSTDVVEVVFIEPEKTIDKSNDAVKGIEQSPIWARYQPDEIYDGTNLAAGTNYYPASTGASMDGYKGLSFTGKLIDADSTVTITIEATNDEDATNADWIQVYFTDVKNDTTVNSISVSDGTTTFAIKLTDFNYSLFRVKVVTTDATNTVIIKQRRLY